VILVGKFKSHEIGEKCASRRSLIITQLYPINCNFTGNRCSIIRSLLLHCMVATAQPTRTTAYMKLLEVYRMQYDSPAQKCRPVINTVSCVRRLCNSHVAAAACKGSNGDASMASGHHHYRVNTQGDHWRDGRANDRLNVHRITHHMTNGQHGSKDVVLIMPSGWTAASSQRCKAMWTYWVIQQRRWHRPLCRWNIG